MSGVMGDFEREVRKERSCEIALHLIEKGTLSLEDIADATGLSLAEVKELAKKTA